jgi:hypothetical protein
MMQRMTKAQRGDAGRRSRAVGARARRAAASLLVLAGFLLIWAAPLAAAGMPGCSMCGKTCCCPRSAGPTPCSLKKACGEMDPAGDAAGMTLGKALPRAACQTMIRPAESATPDAPRATLPAARASAPPDPPPRLVS